MRTIIDKAKLKYRGVNKFNSLINFSQNRLVEKISDARKEVSLFDYEALIGLIPINKRFLIPENNLYGNGYKLLNYKSKIDFNNSGIEHGFIYGSLVQDFHLKSWTTHVVTFSDYRRDIINKKLKKEVICVGPYIHYADYILDEDELMALKDSLGRVLLVVPQHSIAGADVNYSADTIIDYVKSISSGYDSVIICMYWHDISMKKHLPYIKNGFKIVSAGHSNDIFFLDRLKTIYYLSDNVLTNSVGTHVGYSIFMNKPLKIIKQKIQIYIEGKHIHESTQRNISDRESLLDVKSHIIDLFSDRSFDVITKEQYQFIGDLFGFKYAERR
ncbi:hypothetical protein [Sphingobacterium prati]|uniref:hypothetical protein n=1 Tax=Sphingobacterium prati TaxID=2737006 RepID=UPI0015535678|nr:hypothetical protein [Sphingobacterium prati]NPE45857.1 hypothetical protein [Sphingobacterium prati]